MLKGVLSVLILIMALPAYAGVYEDALNSNNSVFLYLYTKNCRYCKMFNPLYDKLTEGSYKDNYKFVKVDANTEYGAKLMEMYKAGYVPFVVLADAKRQKLQGISPSCLLNQACTDKELRLFLK